MRIIRSFFAALGFIVASTTAAFALSIPTPAPTAAAPASLPAHIPQYQVLQGCFHNSNGNCPAPGVSTLQDYADLKTALDYDETDTRAISFAHVAQIATLVYTDPVYIHGGTTLNGTTYCPQGTPALPGQILQHERSYSSSIIIPNSNQGTCNSQTVSTVLGDITSPAAWAFWDQAVQQNFGTTTIYGNPYKTGLDIVRIDDLLAGQNNGQTSVVCANTGTLTTTGTFTSCTQAGPPAINGGTYTITADLLPFPQQAYPNYTGQYYVNGAKNFFRSFAQYGFPLDVNDFTNPDIVAEFASDPDHDNILEVTCENCIANNAGFGLWSDTIWRNHIDMLIYAQSIGLHVHFYHPVMNSYSNQEYVYGSMWLGMLDPKGVVETDQNGGSLTGPTSGVAVSPLSFIIPTQPLADPQGMFANPIALNYQPTNPPLNNFAGALRKATGIYAREFSQCYDMHTGTAVAVGPCASIVATPAAASSTTISSLGLSGTYAHTVSWTGTGILTQSEYGDSYTINETATAPTTIAQGTAVLLFQ